MQNEQPTKDIFCAKCQEVTPHTGSVDLNGELVFACQNIPKDANGETIKDENGIEVKCDRFIKFPAETTPEQFNDLITVHQDANIGQVSLEAQEARLGEIMGAAPKAPVQPETPVNDEQTAENDQPIEDPVDSIPS